MLVIAAALLAGSVALPETGSKALTGVAAPIDPSDLPRPFATLPVPAALTDPRLDLRSGPVPVPIQLLMPTIGVNAAVLGVGMTPKNVMDAPMGKADNPDWQQAFWYRGSAVPGAASSSVIAAHVSDPLGRGGAFAHLVDLKAGDPIVVHDNRNGLDVRFEVTDATSYPLAATTDPAVLTQIYGAGPVAGRWAEPSADGGSYLTLVTCDGTFVNGTHDHRLVVHATRVL
jgi:hypothetical protein